MIPMIKRTLICAALALGLIIYSGLPVEAAGLLKPLNGNQNAVEMKSHHVHVVINNGFARTEVDQVFVNTGQTDLEAIYSFPVPKNASLSEVSLWIDGAEVIGEVLEKQAAKKTYEDQKSKGNKTALAVKNDFKTFDVRVSPVTAGDETRVRLVYYQPLEIDLNIGRYVYPLAEGNVDEERISFWETDNRVRQSFKFTAILKSAFPVKDIRLPEFQNQAVINQKAGGDETGQRDVYEITLTESEGADLSKDIVLYYRLDDHTPARVELIPYRESADKNGTFMLVITPGDDLGTISNGTDWTFVLDVSGSMGGHKLSTLVGGVRKSIKKMSPDHRFRIVTFNDQARDVTGGYLSATPENVAQAILMLDSLNADNGTALYAGLETAYKGLDRDRTTGIILVTDGVANVGPSTHAELMALHRQHDCRLFTFVIGNSANQPLLDALARESGGFAMNVSASDDLIGRILQARSKMTHESLHDVQVRFRGERVSDITPDRIGNLFIGQQIVLFGQYTSAGKIDVELTGKIDGQEKVWTTEAVLPEQDLDNPEIERLWAMSAIEEISEKIRQNGERRALKNDIVKLATEYSLVTDYTAMVVLSRQEMEGLGINANNARRVQKERQVQTRKAAAPVNNYRVAQTESSSRMFGNQSAPGIGTGAVGPLFIGLIGLVKRFRSRKQ